MRIIKEGKIPGGKEATCNQCNTIFEYYPDDIKYEDDFELVEIFDGYGWDYYIECPLCKYKHIIDQGFIQQEHFSFKEWFDDMKKKIKGIEE